MSITDPRERLIAARMRLIRSASQTPGEQAIPYWGVPATRMELVETDRYPEVACDGQTLFYNPEYINKCSNKELHAMFARFANSIVKRHHLRMGPRNPDKWSFSSLTASDFALSEAEIFAPNSLATEDSFKWAKDLSTEAIYETLPDEPNGTLGSGRGQLLPCPDMSPAGRKEEEARITDLEREGITEQKKHNSRRGNTPGWFQQILDKLDESKIPWQEHLRRFMVSKNPTRLTYTKPNRRFTNYPVFIPGIKKGELSEGLILIDTSGSTSNDWKFFLSELNGILNSLEVSDIHVIQCDAEVANYSCFSSGDRIEPKIHGTGGSDFRPAFRMVEKKSLSVEWCLIFSDMDIAFPEAAPPYPCIAFSTTDKKGPTWAENYKFKRLIIE